MFVICDNCSDDNTEQIVRSYDDPRISYVKHSKNIGIVNNANSCLEKAESKYFYLFHHDDLMLPENIERKVQVLENNSNVGLVHSNFMRIDSDGTVWSNNSWEKESTVDHIENGSIAFDKYIKKMPLGARYFIGSILARKSVYDKVGSFNTNYNHCHDSEMWLRMLLHCDVACIGDALVKYRVHQTSTSSSWGHFQSFPFLKEHYSTALEVINDNIDLIPKAKELKKEVCLLFAKRAIELANTSAHKRDYDSGSSFLTMAFQSSPQVLLNIDYWKAIIKLTLKDVWHQSSKHKNEKQGDML